jgi:hypothetical protein
MAQQGNICGFWNIWVEGAILWGLVERLGCIFGRRGIWTGGIE